MKTLQPQQLFFWDTRQGTVPLCIEAERVSFYRLPECKGRELYVMSTSPYAMSGRWKVYIWPAGDTSAFDIRSRPENGASIQRPICTSQ